VITRELRRLLPIAAVGVLLGITSALIVIDHPVEPLDPLLPSIDPRPLRAIAQADASTRARFERTPPAREVRAVGSAFLAWNKAAVARDPRGPTREELAGELRAALGVARAALGGEDALADALDRLRAYHTEVFVEELARRARTGVASIELENLSGALPELLSTHGWLDPKGKARVPWWVLRARYKLHWTSIVYGLEPCERAPAPICYGQTTLPLPAEELRAFLAFLVAQPVVPEGPRDATAIARRRLAYLERLAALDAHAGAEGREPLFLASYPYPLGHGALAYHLGRFEVAERDFRGWLREHPSDARARNWLLATLAKISGE
jgi:hypothetical protein